MGYITVFYKEFGIRLSCTKWSVLTIQLVLAAGLVGKIHIEITDSTSISRCNHQAQLIGSHTRYITAIGQSVAQPSTVFVYLKMTADEVGHVLGISHDPHLVEIPLCSPHGIRIVEVESRFAILHLNLANGTIVFGVSAVYVTGNTTTQDGMIQSCVEFHLIILVRCFNRNATQMLIPNLMRLLFSLVKSQVLRFSLKVLLGILHRSVGHTHLHGNLFLIGCLERQISTRAQSRSGQRVSFNGFAVESTYPNRFLVDNGMEIQGDFGTRLVFLYILRQGDHPAFDYGSVILNLYRGILHGTTFALAVTDIKEDAALLAGREGVTLEGNTRGGCHFGRDIVVLE